jgi:diguanylate cyclase (GGDEF)-like protein
MESIIPAEPRRIRASQADEPLRGSFLFAPARDEELAQHAFLRGVPRHTIEAYLLRCPVIELDPGHFLIRRGDVKGELYLLLSGRLVVQLGDATLATIPAGQTVGELAVLDAQPATADVVAEVSCRVLALDEATFWRVVAESHEVAVNMLRLFAARIRRSNEHVNAAQEQRRSMERLSRTDPLTGLANRRWLDETLPRLLARAERDRHDLSVLAIDVDHFKKVNDTWGHATGDRVLVALAELLKKIVRPTDVCVRIGGEEMLVVLPSTGLEGARVVAERVRAAVRELSIDSVEGVALPPLGVSIGVATLEPGEDAGALVHRADLRLYDAKHNGRNRVEG